ncbi:Dabb family protein [Paenibacillus sp. GP183]|uniref:Dabb family protein n=1 Tax=Paenibacillus sp. GP183 TaxID=1882751 RepID=UPI00089BEA6B|nr:Dabb family protein [Paenibacillus sp. GP183]SEC64344.1 Stress responsive A/B Barrel Domain [Paenibacillus sp. GP183]
MNNQVIRHMVIFNLKYPKGSLEAEKFLNEGKSILSSIPVVQNFGAFRQVSIKNDYDYGFSMDFSNQEDYDSYNNHPLHVQFVQERWLLEVDRFLEIDFVHALT